MRKKQMSKLGSTLALLFVLLAAQASFADNFQCMRFMEESRAARSLVFDSRSPESIINAIAAMSYTDMRFYISDHLRQAEFFLRGGSDAKRYIVNRLNALWADPDMRYTIEHSWAVAALAVKLGKVIGMKTEELVTVFYSGLAHDLGKALVPPEILNKPTGLTDAEYQKMKHHVAALRPLFEVRMAEDPEFRIYIENGADHHERWDGKGYPHGIAGEDISLTARLLGIADAFHAMTSNRPYRAGMSLQVTVGLLNRDIVNKPGQFDPKLIQIFLEDVSREIENSNRRAL